MNRRTLGTAGPDVSAIGLGCMGMLDLYGPADRSESIATIHAALDAGITLLNTGDARRCPAATAATCSSASNSAPSAIRQEIGPATIPGPPP